MAYSLNKGNVDNFFTMNLEKSKDDLRREILFQITKQSGMLNCVKCNGENVVNQLKEEEGMGSDCDYVDKGKYEVTHICPDCKFAWIAKITLGSSRVRKIKLASKDELELVKTLMLEVMSKARNQIEKKVRQGRETTKVIEKKES